MIVIDDILKVEQHLKGMEAVIFDLDDTLYSEKDYVRSGYQKIAEYFDDLSLAGEMWGVFLNGGKAIDEVLAAKDLLGRKDEALHIYRFHTPTIKLYPGVPEMLERIRENHKIGIITDGRPEGQRAKLAALNLTVDAVIITDDLGGIEFRKPCPKAYEIMQRIFDIPFSKMVYVGDNIKKDFVSPQRLGMESIFFNNKDGLYCNT